MPNTAPLGIIGPGGIGKTNLTLKVLHDSQVRAHFAKERFFVSCEGSSSTDKVLGQLAIKLSIQRLQNVPLWPTVIENLRTRQRILIVLDNFEFIWSSTNDILREESEVVLAQLAVLDELTLIVTTRGNLLPEAFTWGNFSTTELDTLSSTAAPLTFNDLSCTRPGVLISEIEAHALTELLREVDFMPLAVTLLARLDVIPSRLLPSGWNTTTRFSSQTVTMEAAASLALTFPSRSHLHISRERQLRLGRASFFQFLVSYRQVSFQVHQHSYIPPCPALIRLLVISCVTLLSTAVEWASSEC